MKLRQKMPQMHWGFAPPATPQYESVWFSAASSGSLEDFELREGMRGRRRNERAGARRNSLALSPRRLNTAPPVGPALWVAPGGQYSVGATLVVALAVLSPLFRSPATWTVWLGSVYRAPEGQRPPAAPALSSIFPPRCLCPAAYPPRPIQPPSASRRRRRYLNGFGGGAGGGV